MLFSSIVCVCLLPLAAQQVGCNHLQGQLHVRHLLLLESEFGSFSFFATEKNVCLQWEHRWIGFTDLEDTDHLDPFDFSLSHSLFVYFGVWFRTPRNPKMLLTKNWTCIMSFFVFPASLGRLPSQFILLLSRPGRKPKKTHHPFGLVEVSMQLKFFPCVSLPFWHIVSPDIRCISCFLGGFGGGEGFLVKRRDQKSKEREMERGLENWLSLDSVAFRFLGTCFWISDWWINMRHIFLKQNSYVQLVVNCWFGFVVWDSRDHNPFQKHCKLVFKAL